MLDAFLEHPFFLNRHRQAPLLKERESFLRHLQQPGTSHKALRNISSELLHVVRLLKAEGDARCLARGDPASGARLGARATHESQGAFIR